MKVVFSPTKQKLYSPPWDWIRDKPIHLTRNKTYDILETRSETLYDSYLVMNDKGYTEWFNSYHFVPLDTIRNDKINTILK